MTTEINKEKRKPSTKTAKLYDETFTKFKLHFDETDPQKTYNSLSQLTYMRGSNGTPQKYSQGAIMNILSAFLYHLKKDPETNNDNINKYSAFITLHLNSIKSNRLAKKNLRTKKGTVRKAVIKEGTFKFDEYEAMLNEYIKNNSGRVVYKYWVIGCLYILTVPRRVMDYAFMKVAKTLKDTPDTKFNYFVLSNNTFIFNQYKTAYAYGQEKIKCPAKLAKVLKEFINRENLHTGDLMFNNEMYINRAIKDIFKTSVNSLRKTHNIKFFGGKSTEEILEHARQMGHSVITGITQYLD